MAFKESFFAVALSMMISFSVGGCYFTLDRKTPLLTEATADFPFRRIVIEDEESGERSTMIEKDGSYSFPDDPGFGGAIILLKTLGNDIFLVQAVFPTPKFPGVPTTVYGIFKLEGDQIAGLFCPNYSIATLNSVGIQMVEVGTAHAKLKICNFENLGQLSDLSAKKPDGKSVTRAKLVSIER
jgi:hypothetical protein